MFRDSLKQLKKDFTDAKDARSTFSSDPVLSQIDLDKISDADMDALFKSEELEGVISKIARETHYDAVRQIQERKANKHIEIKVLYKDENGNMKLSDPDDKGTDMQYTVLQLLDAGNEERVERYRQQRLLNGYHYQDTSGSGEVGEGREGETQGQSDDKNKV
eukprot:sb/3472778/